MAKNQIMSNLHISTNLALRAKDEFEADKKIVHEGAIKLLFGAKEGYKEGIDNRLYQMTTDNFPQLPSSMVASLTRDCKAEYKADVKNGLLKGRRSLRMYRFGSPIPLPNSQITKRVVEDELSFNSYSISFISVNLKKDNSNYTIAKQYFENVRDSQLLVDGNKLYILAVFDIEIKTKELDYTKAVGVDLGMKYPAVS